MKNPSNLSPLHQFRTIQAYPVETLLSLNKQRKQKLFVEDTSVVFGVPFDKFNEASVKTKVSTSHAHHVLYRFLDIHCIRNVCSSPDINTTVISRQSSRYYRTISNNITASVDTILYFTFQSIPLQFVSSI